MKERPILFSGAMVRAILEGRKTMTRRVVKDPICTEKEVYGCDSSITWYGKYGLRSPCKFGQVGDRLWVREAFAIVPRTAYSYSEGVQQTLRPNDDQYAAAIYREGWVRSKSGFSWRPSIYMPRWASRITLEIVNVRVERLHDISEDDAQAEGVDLIHSIGAFEDYMNDTNTYTEARQSFASLWESINGVGSWDDNPWVWVIEFKRVEGSGPC